jgi:SAM-dependent methyltransferase
MIVPDLLKDALTESPEGFLVGTGADSHYWGELSQTEFSRLLEQVENGNDFDTSIFHYFAHHPRKDLFPYITDCWGRGSWHALLAQNNGVAVDLGAGLGAITEFLSGHYRQVFSIEGCRDRCRFLALRKKRKLLKNVTIINDDVYNLPFPDGTVDLVACNGVMEWVGLGRSGRVEEVQLQVLQEMRRILKPDGVLYIGIENRWALAYLLGMPDHSGLRFTSLVPRWMASLMMKFQTPHSWFSVDAMKSSYRTYTYSRQGYNSLLRNAGFNRSDCFSVEPSYDLPTYSYPVGQDSHRLEMFYRLFGSRHIPRFIHQHLCSSFFIFASKNNNADAVKGKAVFFGYLEQCTVEGNSILRVDQTGHMTEEPVHPGINLLQLPRVTRKSITAADIIAAFEQSVPDCRCRNSANELSDVLMLMDRLLSPLLSARTMHKVQDALTLQYFDSYYHGDFWIGNLLCDKTNRQILLIDSEKQKFGTPELDMVDFIVDYVINHRTAAGFTIDLGILRDYCDFTHRGEELVLLSIIRQVLRYSPSHRSNVFAYRYLSILQEWERSGAMPAGVL